MTSNKLAEISIFKGAVQKVKELSTLIDFVRKKDAPQRVLEIGSAEGGTFWLWCQLASNNATVISLDLPKARFGTGFSYNKKVMHSYNTGSQNIHLVRKNSHSTKSEQKLTKILGDSLIDFLFIDGDHTYEGVKDDYNRYEKYVAKGGIIIFHDIIYHDQVPDCQVNQFWEELKNKHTVMEFIDPEPDDRGWGSWGGIGVLIKE